MITQEKEREIENKTMEGHFGRLNIIQEAVVWSISTANCFKRKTEGKTRYWKVRLSDLKFNLKAIIPWKVVYDMMSS